jgi:hypothetical protein
VIFPSGLIFRSSLHEVIARKERNPVSVNALNVLIVVFMVEFF